MRTTVSLDSDVVTIIDQLRSELHIGMSEAVNQLVRAATTTGTTTRTPFQQQTMSMGSPLVDLSNVGEVLDLLDTYGDDQ
ncbi:MAG: ribbon-helix-helix protein, CopG family [Stackebrandtia sp.]